MSDSIDKPLIQSRVIIMGEEAVPPDEWERLEDRHMKVFLHEPNPYEWPKEMQHLIRYLPDRERMKWRIIRFIEEDDRFDVKTIEQWAKSLWEALLDSTVVQDRQIDQAAGILTDYIRERIEGCLMMGCGPESGEKR